jgi:hypothetical protein
VIWPFLLQEESMDAIVKVLESAGARPEPYAETAHPALWHIPYHNATTQEDLWVYPFGWSGEDMLPGAMILGVAAVIDAMSAHRPCEPSLVVELAWHEISHQRGILNDPWIVAALARILSGNMFGNFFRDHAC